MIQYSIETLYHFRCNCGQWWSIADFDGELDDGLHCPRCGEWQLFEATKDFQSKLDIELVSEMADKEITRLREALEFYATRENYCIDLSGAHGGVCIVQVDNGKAAREALGKTE